MQQNALAFLLDELQGKTESAGITRKSYKGYVTPRRLAVILEGLPTQQEDVNTELKGPKVDAPEQAIQGFLKKSGLKLEQLEKRDGIYVARIHQKGRPTADILKEIIEKILADFPWPKSMRWGAGEQRWVRPLQSILCLFDGKIVPVEFAGIKAGNTTQGHRFLAPGAITISAAAQYPGMLENAKILPDAEARQKLIKEKTEEAAKKLGLKVKDDRGLLEEVTGLVEWPVILVGTIDAKYMDLPKEVLISEMRAHQKYFALEKADGSLADKFLITANMEAKDGGKAIITGNERVLRARLADGRFFWDQDRKKKLEDWAESLANVTYHAKLGSVADKVERITALALQLAEPVKADKKKVERAARLCKADLVTGMVGEFPELQGVMGRYYAVAQKEDAFVADAIREHYKPMGPADSVPHEPIAIAVALADKLDTLIGMFAIGEKPTGSKDPFALRRAALGIIRIILENNIRLPLKECFKAVPTKVIALHKAHEKLVKKTEAKLAEGDHRVGKYVTISETAYEDLETAVPANLQEILYEFFADRLKVQLKDQGIRHDAISAVVAKGDDDLVRVVARAKALQNFLGSDDGANLLAAYKRAANILSIEEKKDKTTYNKPVAAAQLALAEEKSLHTALEKTLGTAKPLLAKEDFVGAMAAFSSLRAPVDTFFDKVMVNDKDAATRANRLNLLASLRATLDSIANFALIEG